MPPQPLTPGAKLPDGRLLVSVPNQLAGYVLLDARSVVPSRDMTLLVLGPRPTADAAPSPLSPVTVAGRLRGVRDAVRVPAWNLPVKAGQPVQLPPGAWAVAKPGEVGVWEGGMAEATVVGAYHIALMGDWRRIVDEQSDRLVRSGLLARTERVLIGVVGGELKPSDLRPELAAKAVISCHPDLKRYEFPTLKMLRDHAEGRDFKAWYIHTKGVSGHGDPTAVREWRNMMELHAIDRWRDCVDALDEFDCCGINLKFRGARRVNGKLGECFGGNFWWATSRHLASLPKVEELDWKDREQAQAFVRLRGTARSFMDAPGGDLHMKKDWPTPATKGREENVIRLGRDTGLGDRICALTAARELARRNPDKKVLFSGMDEIVRAFGDGLVQPAPFDGLTDKMYCDGRFRKKGSSPDGNLVGCFMTYLDMKPDGRRPELPDAKLVLTKGSYIAVQPWAYYARNPSEQWIQSLVDKTKAETGLRAIVVGHPGTKRFLKGVDESFVSGDVIQFLSLIRGARMLLCPRSAGAHVAAAYGVPTVMWDPGDGEAWLNTYGGWDHRVIRNESPINMPMIMSRPKRRVIYRIDKTNIGDMVSNPSRWFDLGEVELIDIENPLACQKHSGMKIFGSSGLTTFGQRFRDAIGDGKDVVSWGVGMNARGKTEDQLPDFLRKCSLASVRDHVPGWKWVPCVSCMNPIFDHKHETKHEFVVYEHLRFPIPIEGPRMKNNVATMDEAVKFLSSGETVITSSYHGAYWATLLGRMVIVYKSWSSKFMYSKHSWEFFDGMGSWKDLTPRSHPHALSESRQANQDFYKSILAL